MINSLRALKSSKVAMAGAFLLLLACSTVPLTGRSQFAILPESEMASLGLDSYKQALSEATLSKDPGEVDTVRRVGNRLAKAAEDYLKANGQSIEHYKWEFNVIKDDKTVNAWCLPGGKVAVYTGLLPIAKNDDGLAVVMGHEIAHAIARHGNERMSQGMATQLGGVALSTALTKQPATTKNLFMTSYGVASQVGVLLPYSRMHESEADRIGLTLMAMAGYNPDEAIPFWQRMNESGGSRPPEFLSTHPAPDSRIQNIRSYIPEAKAAYRPQGK